MRLLCLTPRLPWPPDRGDRLRAYHLLATFAREHDVTLLSACEDPAEVEQAKELEDVVGALHTVPVSRASSIAAAGRNAWRRLPLQVLYYRNRRFREALARLRPESFDVLWVHLFRLAPYVLPRRGSGAHRIVDLTDVVSTEIARSLPYRSLPGRWLYRLEGRRIAAYERWVASHSDEVWVVSTAERDALLESAPEAPVRVVSNGFDSRLLELDDAAAVDGRILFVGHLGVPHNVDAARFLAREILPRVRRSDPRAVLRLVGAGGGPAVERLGRLEGVEHVGFVPDLADELRRAAVFVAPLRFSAGLQNKVLEAMAAGRAVVTTPRVQEGLDASDRELLVGDDADSLARQTLRVLADRRLARELGRAARRHVRSHHGWEQAGLRLGELERELTARKG